MEFFLFQPKVGLKYMVLEVLVLFSLKNTIFLTVGGNFKS